MSKVSRRMAAAFRAGLLMLAAPLFVPRVEAAEFGARTDAGSDASPVVTFSGLRVYPDNSSTFVVSLTKRTPVEVSQDGTLVKFLLAGAKVRFRNNKNPLLAEYFKANVLSVKLDDTKAGVTVAMRLREAIRPEHQMVDSGSGVLLRIDIPAPSQK